MTPIGLLLDMLTYRRPAGSQTEADFIDRFIVPLGTICDDYGNHHVWIANPDGSPSRMLWSCHTDTVHDRAGKQTIHYDATMGVIALSKRSKRGKWVPFANGVSRDSSNCLGADDTAGVFLCMGMIKAGVPGHYVFHYGEEMGGQGSGDLARYEPALLANADIAIAFDRRGSGDIITHQFGRRCASEAFAESLAAALYAADPALDYRSCRGSYTDTAEYMDHIPECSNLSVGYANEHSANEILYSHHTFRLLAVMIKLDVSALVVTRVPEPECAPTYSYVVHDHDDRTLCTCGHAQGDHWPPQGDCTWCLCDGFESEDDSMQDAPPYADDYLYPEYAEVQAALSFAHSRPPIDRRCFPHGLIIPWNKV